MFSLIIVLISIALVVALAVAGLYYGGFLQTEGAERAAFAKILSQGAQIQGAAAVHYGSSTLYARDIPALVTTDYLTGNPMNKWDSFLDTAYLPGVSKSMCDRLNARESISTPPLCTDPAVVGKTVCCRSS